MTDSFRIMYSPAALDDLRAIFSYIAYELQAEQAATNQTKRIRKQIHGGRDVEGIINSGIE